MYGYGSRLRNPATAALFAAVATLVAKYVDHRIGKKPDYLVDYIKAILFNAAIVFFIVNAGSTSIRMGTMRQNIMNAPF